MKEKIINIIIESLKELNVTFENREFDKPTADTQLFGSAGYLDSLGLVALIAAVETKISQDFNKEIVIASERAMSQESSPFKSVQTLANYVEKLLREE